MADFAIAQQAVGARGAAVQARRDAHAQGQRETAAERTGGSLEAMDEADIGVALINRSELAQGVELVERRIGVAGFGHNGVQHRRGMALGKNEAVAIRPQRVLRIDLHVIEKELNQDFDGGKGASGVPGFGRANHLHDLAPHLFGQGLQLV
jgi:hypothetical protein